MVVVGEAGEGAVVGRAARRGGERPVPAQELARAARELRQQAVGTGRGVEVGRVVGCREVVELERVCATGGMPGGVVLVVVLVVVGIGIGGVGGERRSRRGLGGRLGGGVGGACVDRVDRGCGIRATELAARDRGLLDVRGMRVSGGLVRRHGGRRTGIGLGIGVPAVLCVSDAGVGADGRGDLAVAGDRGGDVRPCQWPAVVGICVSGMGGKATRRPASGAAGDSARGSPRQASDDRRDTRTATTSATRRMRPCMAALRLKSSPMRSSPLASTPRNSTPTRVPGTFGRWRGVHRGTDEDRRDRVQQVGEAGEGREDAQPGAEQDAAHGGGDSGGHVHRHAVAVRAQAGDPSGRVLHAHGVDAHAVTRIAPG